MQKQEMKVGVRMWSIYAINCVHVKGSSREEEKEK